ncbi:endonuclease/exonuclease/phosphatase family metal-dependent hydrolase [Nocardiopsis mwathae]|uniref:Endonuclease/exonuclease/phosphatase family metal-dependent hydrolase n=1 Tax=Nocardiopsis mwathae TaxID=1472723 RepID=A0A7W9YI10_9ACTN|nr:endonuclease/exonuclease/phosphatase family protein [Nocardiopsis mwathae]MBB6172539.1 endonuclease/exonuclease/phosphatase family metal-dependent hydrolase [Nocardiopsis mwathae]
MTLRVLSYNVRALRDDPAAVRRVIAACRPDVVCLQEAPRFLGWRRRRRALARGCGLVPAVNRRPGGLAVLHRPGIRVLHAEHRLLRRHPRLHRRALSLAVLDVGGRPLLVGCTHLDLDDRARQQHAAEVLALFTAAAARHSAPGVLAGDINCTPQGPAWRLLAAELCDTGAARPRGEPLTFPARHPRARIDGVFATRGLTVTGAGVPVGLVPAADLAAASDHRPVLAEIDPPR